MQTLHHQTGVKPDHALADRLHALWQRRCARFRAVHYAYRLADEHAERVGHAHPTYVRARALSRRAARLMDILHKQTARLARAQIAAVGLIATVAAAPAVAGDDWTSAQRDKGMALAGLVALNWAQEHSRARSTDSVPATSMYVPGQPGRAYAASYSGSPAAGATTGSDARTGDIGRVNRQFLLGAVAGALILDALPSEYRDAALDAGLVLEVGVVANNLRLGVGFRF